MTSEAEEISFLKTRLQDKEQSILDLEKKLRLIEFRAKKQVQEITLQMETEKVKLTEIEEKFRNQSQLLEEFQEKVQFHSNRKSIKQDSIILRLREDNQKVQGQPTEDEQTKRFKPRQSMIVRMGNDISQLPSYTDLVTMVQQQSGDQNQMQDHVKQVEDQAVSSIVERDNVILELQEKERNLQDQLSAGEQKIMEQNNQIQSYNSNQQAQDDNQKLISTINQLSQQNDLLRSNTSEQFTDMQDRLKEQHMQNMLNQENDYGKREALLIEQLQQFENRVRMQEEIINESSFKLQEEVNNLNKLHAKESDHKDKEIDEYKNSILTQTKHSQDHLNKSNQEISITHETQVKQLNKELDVLKQNNETVNKKVIKLENEKERKETLIQEYKQTDQEQKAEIQQKTDQINNLVDTYEAKIQDLQISLKQQKKKFEQDIETQKEGYEILKGQDINNPTQLSINLCQNIQKKDMESSAAIGQHLQQTKELEELRDYKESQTKRYDNLLIERDALKEKVTQLEQNINVNAKPNVQEEDKTLHLEKQIQDLNQKLKELSQKNDENNSSSKILDEKNNTLVLQSIQSGKTIEQLQQELVIFKEQHSKENSDSQSKNIQTQGGKNNSQDILELQREVSKLNFKERELLIWNEKLKNDFASERASLLIRQKEIESKNILLEDQIQFEISERHYAEEIAATESVKRAAQALEYEISLQDARKYYKIVQSMKQQKQ